MRSLPVRAFFFLAIASSGCGYKTSPSPAATFALDAGNYALRVSAGGSGMCSNGQLEGTAEVVVTRSGAAWFVRSLRSTDDFAMNFTTDGAVGGSVHGDTAGAITGAGSVTIRPVGVITGSNSSVNVAGGPIMPAAGDIAIVATFTPGGSCTAATWTLTPR